MKLLEKSDQEVFSIGIFYLSFSIVYVVSNTALRSSKMCLTFHWKSLGGSISSYAILLITYLPLDFLVTVK